MRLADLTLLLDHFPRQLDTFIEISSITGDRTGHIPKRVSSFSIIVGHFDHPLNYTKAIPTPWGVGLFHVVTPKFDNIR